MSASLRVISVNVGQPRAVMAGDKMVETGIFKAPVAGPVMVRWLNLDGDRQADLQAHGGVEKAVYAYPAEHYPFWRGEYPDLDLPWGMFGENLTTAGLREDAVGIGDRFRVGEAELVVTQPRIPCYKLGIRFGRDDIVKRFLASGFSGIYFAVAREGSVAAGDDITLIARATPRLTVAEVTTIFRTGAADRDGLANAIAHPALAAVLKRYFRAQLRKGE